MFRYPLYLQHFHHESSLSLQLNSPLGDLAIFDLLHHLELRVKYINGTHALDFMKFIHKYSWVQTQTKLAETHCKISSVSSKPSLLPSFTTLILIAVFSSSNAVITKIRTIKPVLSGPLLSGNSLLGGQLSKSRKSLPLFTVNLTCIKRLSQSFVLHFARDIFYLRGSRSRLGHVIM